MTAPAVIFARWGRRLDAQEAADYLGISRTTFLAQVAEGRWPPPKREGRLTLWDRALLDARVDQDSGITAPSRAGSGRKGGLKWAES